jgi:hypothetical protein
MTTPGELWSYRNAKADEASVAAGHGHIPDAYGYLVQTHRMVTGLIAGIAALTERVAELEERQQ